MPSGHIGHNKFQVLDNDGPQAVLFGSTNWTSHGPCARRPTTRSSRARRRWRRPTRTIGTVSRPTPTAGRGWQGAASSRVPRRERQRPQPITLEDGSGTVDLWFSPNTDKAARVSKHTAANEAVPPDLAEVFDIIAKAQQAILFLAFQPGSPSIIDAVAEALKAKPSLFVRGAVTASQRRPVEFYTAIHGGGSANAPQKHHKGDPPLPEDYRVIRAQGVTKNDAFAQWEAELNQAGHAIIHDKIVVVDPFSDNCVVVTGSHNLGYPASYNNDENMAIIRDHRAIAEAYAAHCLDVYDHYAWRYWLEPGQGQGLAFPRDRRDAGRTLYFSADNQVKSAELGLLARRHAVGGRFADPERRCALHPSRLQAATGGISPAVGPHSAAAHRSPCGGRKAKSQGQKNQIGRSGCQPQRSC